MTWEKIGGPQNDGLFRHSVSKKIKFRKYREGKGEIDRSLRTSSLEIARRKRDALIKDLWDEDVGKPKRFTAWEVWTAWELSMALKSTGTKNSIKSAGKHFKPFFESLLIEDITAEWWTNTYIPTKRAQTDKKGRSMAERKFFNEWKWLSMMLKWGDENGKTAKDWRRPKLTNPDPPREEVEVFTPEEYERLLDNSDWSLMTKIVMAKEHFMRRSEIAFTHRDWIDRKDRTISLPAWACKIRKARTFPYNETLEWLFAIMDWKYEKDGIASGHLFPSPIDHAKSIGRDGFMSSWNTCRRKAGIEDKTFHGFRHTGLTEAVCTPGSNIEFIGKFAGVAPEELRATYLHLKVAHIRGVENLARNQ